jgi:hypothetical protein
METRRLFDDYATPPPGQPHRASSAASPSPLGQLSGRDEYTEADMEEELERITAPPPPKVSAWVPRPKKRDAVDSGYWPSPAATPPPHSPVATVTAPGRVSLRDAIRGAGNPRTFVALDDDDEMPPLERPPPLFRPPTSSRIQPLPLRVLPATPTAAGPPTTELTVLDPDEVLAVNALTLYRVPIGYNVAPCELIALDARPHARAIIVVRNTHGRMQSLLTYTSEQVRNLRAGSRVRATYTSFDARMRTYTGLALHSVVV